MNKYIWSYICSTFSLRAFNVFIIIILNSLSDICNDHVIYESGSDNYFVFKFFLIFIFFFKKDGHIS